MGSRPLFRLGPSTGSGPIHYRPGPRCFAASRRSLAFRHATGMANSRSANRLLTPARGRVTRVLHHCHASFPIWLLLEKWEAGYGTEPLKVFTWRGLPHPAGVLALIARGRRHSRRAASIRARTYGMIMSQHATVSAPIRHRPLPRSPGSRPAFPCRRWAKYRPGRSGVSAVAKTLLRKAQPLDSLLARETAISTIWLRWKRRKNSQLQKRENFYPRTLPLRPLRGSEASAELYGSHPHPGAVRRPSPQGGG